MIIECSQMTKSFQGEVLLKDITFKVLPRDHIAIVGVNGAGKTTILKILNQETDYDSGNLFISRDISIGYLSQQHHLNENKTIYQTALDVFQDLIDLEQAIRDLEVQMSVDHNQQILNQYDRLTHQFQEANGFSYPSKIDGVLKGLGFLKDDYDLMVKHLSGGQKTRLSLARLLLQQPKLLLLDEPTNHLDTTAIAFLEDYLRGYPNALVVVSHDRYFINQVSNKIVEVENGRTKTYTCSYDEYASRKKINRAIELKQYVNQQREIKKAQDSIDTLRRFNREKSIKRAVSKEKQLDKMIKVDRPENLPDTISINFVPKIDSAHEVLKVKDLSIGYHQPLFTDCNFTIYKGERIALVGDNGIGKTSLFKAILKQLQPLHGKIKEGSRVEMGYYDQEHQSLGYGATIFNEISDAYPRLNNTEIRSVLALFNFKGDDVFKEMHVLSGGEKGRVVLAKLLLKKANFLILDEPTNHLDINSKEVLETALQSFEGTIFFISHDRYFINQIATKVFELTSDGLHEYDGNYDDYKLRKTTIEKPAEVIITNAKVDQQNSKKLRNEIRKVENTIDKLETKVNILKTKLNDEETINDYVVYNQTVEEIQSLESELEIQLELWQNLQI